MYKIRYLPLALKDLMDITDYIAGQLQGPKAALDWLDELEQAIARLAQFPYSCRVYRPVRELEHEYRLLPVKNYLVFCVVKEEEKVVEIHRVIHGKRDLNQTMK
ncbi:MAG TPA: type II toxin-antitoxin system RelE/ParE family toxin [Clostridia bacterium]|nr:type II toxin-antitoxin system RelE/ParE family toxin [Clostridia bacterium]